MQRTRKSSFVVAAKGRDYVLLRLDGTRRGKILTTIVGRFKSRPEAERAARRGGSVIANIKWHIPLERKQEDMRRRQVPPVKDEIFVGPVTASYLTPQQIATQFQISIKTVIRKCAKLPGVYDWGGKRTPTDKDPRTHVSTLRIPREALGRFKI